jgi:site-specific recombinase XerD
MKDLRVTEQEIMEFERYLRNEERERATIEKYLRDVRFFCTWLGRRPLTREAVIEWKELLQEKGYASVTVNAKLSALNGFLGFLGLEEFRVKFLRIQRQMFRRKSRELTRTDYETLLAAARRQGKERLALLMETICATGIRVSELTFITAEAAREGRAEVELKGKVRIILLPGKLCRKLLRFIGEREITSGEIFRTKSGKGLSRRQIWREMKELCKTAGVESTRVFPHNLRHLFAMSFYKICKDIVKLADVLGHSSIETTRIYLISSGVEHVRQLEQLRLVI